MLEDLWNRFKGAGYTGSISSRSLSGMEGIHFTEKSDSGEDDSFIHEAIYGMDPDYRAVAIIKQAGTKSAEDWAKETFPDGIIDVSFAGSTEDIQNNLDKAILEGLAHKKVLVVHESRAVVKFAYKPEDLL